MKKTIFTKLLSLHVMLALLAAMALTFTACAEKEIGSNEPVETEAPASQTEEPASKIEFTMEVVKADGTKKSFTVKTDKENVGDALVAEGLISGEEGSYGWFITTIDGEYHKYEEDGKYWAFYIDGEYAMTGVSSTPVTAGATYTFKAE